LEEYPLPKEEPYSTSFINQETFNSAKRTGYIKGYDQAMQDFMEKACEWLSKNARNYYSAYATSDKLIEDFKNNMQIDKS
jgi:hypothetical protein